MCSVCALPEYISGICCSSEKCSKFTSSFILSLIIQLVKTDGIQGFQFGNQEKRETSAWQQRSIARSKLEIDFESR